MVLITENPKILGFGEKLPEFVVENLDGNKVSSRDWIEKDFKAIVVSVTCNHCPYAAAYEDRTINLAMETKTRGVDWYLINPNAGNPEYGDDSIAKMLVKSRDNNYPFPYLADLDQTAAKALGAACTPEYYLFNADAKLVYSGRLDDEQDTDKVSKTFLKDAIEDVLAGREVAVPQSHPLGCSIKWV